MEKLIVITGYGAFAGHEVNASGEAVKLLPKELVVGSQKYKILTVEVSVEYEDVDKKVDAICSMKPLLVVHCGVHGAADKIKLEKCSMNGFCFQDFRGKALSNPLLCLKNSGKCDGLVTKLNVDKITKLLNERHRPGMFEASCDVGKYLCGYIYLKSLDIDPSRSLFIHVPCINKPYSTLETAEAIQKVVELCVMDLEGESS